MEDSAIRKVRVTLRDKDSLLLLLDELEVSAKGEVTVELRMKDTKTNYSLLARSPEVLDWDFITAEEPRQEEEYFAVGVTGEGRNDVTKNSNPEFSTLTSPTSKIAKGILRGVEPGNWNEVAWRIESVWRAALKSPAVLFQSDFFWKILEQVSQHSVTPEHAILTKLGEAKWSGWRWEEVDQDITQILNNEWKNGLEKKSLVDLSRVIYGRKS